MSPEIVHIIDDDAAARASLSFLLTTYGVRTQIYAGGSEFFREAKHARGCVLLDLRMPEMDGLSFQLELTRRGYVLPVIMVSAEGDVASAVRAIKYGAMDFLEKGGDETELLAAVQRGLDEFRIEESLQKRRCEAAHRLTLLSCREREVLQGITNGLPNKEIARALQLSPRTVEMHRASLTMKLKIGSVAELVRVAIDGNLEQDAPAAARPREGQRLQ